MYRVPLMLRVVPIFLLYLSASLAADTQNPLATPNERRGYKTGDSLPVSCLNRTIDTGEHVTDSHGNLQYIPFTICNETALPLSFPYNTPLTQTCTIPELPDELYHLIEFFVHSDVPLTCRVPTYPLDNIIPGSTDTADSTGVGSTADVDTWTPFTIAVQGTLQTSHLHLHTNINVLFHTSLEASTKEKKTVPPPSHLIASSAYSVPNPALSSPKEGTKIIRYEPLTLTFNVAWIDGDVLPGMVGRPVLSVTDHRVGFSLISLLGLAAAAGFGALAMLLYERKKSGRANANGLLGGNVGGGLPNGGVARSTGYGGYGGYGGYAGPGKRD
ncbi:uncharacterized protein AB675_2200 [Cyphellophora attinorum]|uniref:Uncharacterized protein n=1 Tax=Cyphellophora attinorum TaxID=1664694 RepID=A0A0N0NPZ8_9EURO|nr:uncharacterized protein AB675_2200 [Phialophora attinorum]KPI43099.1 hypothetical protein AB675_2200 [Phialophora attinorum]